MKLSSVPKIKLEFKTLNFDELKGMLDECETAISRVKELMGKINNFQLKAEISYVEGDEVE